MDTDVDARSRMPRVIAAGVLVAVVLLPLVLAVPTVGRFVYAALALGALVGIVAGVWRNRPRALAAWVLLAASQTTYVVGDMLHTWLGWSVWASAPSATDALYVASYPTLLAGLFILVRRRRGSVEPGHLVDGAIAGIGLALTLWTFVGRDVVDRLGTSVHLTVAAAFPVGDVLLVGLVTVLVSGRGRRSPALWLVAAAAVLMVVGDGLYATVASGTGLLPVIHALWLLSYVSWAAAALHPSSRTLARPTPAGPRSVSTARAWLLTASVLLSPALLAVQQLRGTTTALQIWIFVAATTALYVLVVVRLRITARDNRATRSERDRLRDDLDHRVTHDSLTGLVDRSHALQLTAAALEREPDASSVTALMVVDVDDFRGLNDSMGHRIADDVLRETARRLVALSPAGATVGRLGGDEFVVLVPDLPADESPLELCSRALASVSRPISTAHGSVSVTASAGVSAVHDTTTTAKDLLHEADLAMRRARDNGSGGCGEFDADLRREVAQKELLKDAIRAGLANHEFELHYQPVVNLRTRQVDGYEALVRWQRPGHGLLAPGAFIPVAEESDLICEIDLFVLAEAGRQLGRWSLTSSHRDAYVAVNVSARHLAQRSLVDDVTRVLERADVPAHRLTLEITETVLIDVPSATARLTELRDLGVRISIDDFGTGYTSIRQLQHLPVDTLKIDRSFVAAEGAGAQGLLELMVGAARQFDLRVVAEGVETPAQLAMLVDMDCDAAQGYYLGRPAPLPDVADVTSAEPLVWAARYGAAGRAPQVPEALSDV